MDTRDPINSIHLELGKPEHGEGYFSSDGTRKRQTVRTLYPSDGRIVWKWQGKCRLFPERAKGGDEAE